jgi:hypothetical protein
VIVSSDGSSRFSPLTLGAFCAASAQQEADLPQQLQQLRTEYQQSTEDMQRRIAALEQHKLEQEKEQEKDKERRKEKSETVSGVELAAEQTEKSILG